MTTSKPFCPFRGKASSDGRISGSKVGFTGGTRAGADLQGTHNPRSDSRENLCFLQAYIPQEDGKAQIGDVLYIGTPEKCREPMAQLNAGEF